MECKQQRAAAGLNTPGNLWTLFQPRQGVAIQGISLTQLPPLPAPGSPLFSVEDLEFGGKKEVWSFATYWRLFRERPAVKRCPYPQSHLHQLCEPWWDTSTARNHGAFLNSALASPLQSSGRAWWIKKADSQLPSVHHHWERQSTASLPFFH